MTGALSDYTQLVKEYKPQGQQKSLWEQFFTGTTTAYQNLSQQAQDVASYDISQAYANYKKQQLQTQMNEKLGAGFQQQIGSQLKSAYGSEYGDIKGQELSTLYDIEQQKASALEKGEKEFSKLGQQLRTYDKLIAEYAQYAGIQAPENMTTTTYDEYGVATTELTDYGRMYYYDVLNKPVAEDKMNFDKWLLSEDLSTSTLDYEEREAFWDAYRQNPELFRNQVTGLNEDFDYEATKTKYEAEQTEKARAAEIDDKISNISTAATKTYGYSSEGSSGLNKDLYDITEHVGYTQNQLSFETGYNANKSKYTTIVKIKDSALTETQRNELRNMLGYYADTKLKNGQWSFTATSKSPSYDQLSYQQLLSILKNKE